MREAPASRGSAGGGVVTHGGRLEWILGWRMPTCRQGLEHASWVASSVDKLVDRGGPGAGWHDAAHEPRRDELTHRLACGIACDATVRRNPVDARPRPTGGVLVGPQDVQGVAGVVREA